MAKATTMAVQASPDFRASTPTVILMALENKRFGIRKNTAFCLL